MNLMVFEILVFLILGLIVFLFGFEFGKFRERFMFFKYFGFLNGRDIKSFKEYNLKKDEFDEDLEKIFMYTGES